MRYIARVEGKRREFPDRQAYLKYLEELKDAGVIVERSRKARPDVKREPPREKPPLQRFLFHTMLEVPKIRFSLVHPTRGRPEQFLQSAVEWIDKAVGAPEYIVGLDADDAQSYLPSIQKLIEIYGYLSPFRVVVQSNRNVVEAINHAAAIATGDILIYVSDDFGCPQAWDFKLDDFLLQCEYDVEEPFLIEVSDGGQTALQTITVMTRALYEKLGYMYHPGYLSMWVDNDLTETVRTHGLTVNAHHLEFPHRHWTRAGGMPVDETYRKQNSSEAWVHGEALFLKRKEEGFPI